MPTMMYLRRYTVLGATVTLLLVGAVVAVVVSAPPARAVPRPPTHHHAHYTITDLGTLPGFAVSYASSINTKGQVVGWSSSSSYGSYAFPWQNGVMRDLGTLLGASDSVASGINDTGQVVGWSWTSGGTQHAVLWTPSN
jgi:probable HAF family extracellular repeat protein